MSLSVHDHGNCSLCDEIEAKVADLERRLAVAQEYAKTMMRQADEEHAKLAQAQEDNRQLQQLINEKLPVYVEKLAQAEEQIRFMGGTVEPDGGMRIDMKKWNAIFRCERHRGVSYKQQDLERCMPCLMEKLATLVTWMNNVPTDDQLDRPVPRLGGRTGRQILADTEAPNG